MSYSVTVLLGNGRRQRVSVKLNTPILVILEEVCRKNKLKSEDYDVKCHNRLLDITSTVQFCGVTNNGQLELVPATKSRTESPVKVFLQLESGERLSSSFLPSSSLQDILDKLCSEEDKLKPNPVIIYTRQEVLGNKLKTTSLKQLGLTGGSALLRLLHRTEDQLRNQSSSCIYNLPVKPKVEEPERRRKKEGTLQDFANETSISKENVHREESSPASSNKSTESMNMDKPSTSNKCTIDETKPDDSGVKLGTSSAPLMCVKSKVDPPFDINEVKYLGERYALIFRTDQIQSPRFDDASDDFFELTVDDAKSLLRDIRRTRCELEEGQLETTALKERKRSMLFERTISIYPYCVVRILLPNRIALQGVFKSTETVKEVTDFVKSFIEISILDFYLYTAPPKKLVKMTQSLLELGAVPGINFHFGGQYVEENPTGPFLRQQFIDEAVSPSVALRVANHFRRAGGIQTPKTPAPDSPLVILEIENNDHGLNSLPPVPPNLRREPPKNLGSGGKVPKWFKPL